MTSLLGLSSGAYYRDHGTLIDRIYDRTGIKLLACSISESCSAARTMPSRAC